MLKIAYFPKNLTRILKRTRELHHFLYWIFQELLSYTGLTSLFHSSVSSSFCHLAPGLSVHHLDTIELGESFIPLLGSCIVLSSAVHHVYNLIVFSFYWNASLNKWSIKINILNIRNIVYLIKILVKCNYFSWSVYTKALSEKRRKKSLLKSLEVIPCNWVLSLF